VQQAQGTHKIGQMNVAVRVEQDVVGLDVSVDDALLVDVSHGASELGHPEAHRLLGKCFSRDVESQIAAIHEVDDNVSVGVSVMRVGGLGGIRYRYSMSWKL
jgi:hypothetical protein